MLLPRHIGLSEIFEFVGIESNGPVVCQLRRDASFEVHFNFSSIDYVGDLEIC